MLKNNCPFEKDKKFNIEIKNPTNNIGENQNIPNSSEEFLKNLLS